MLITHDMGVIAETADRVAVMYAGRIAEIGPVRDVVQTPAAPLCRGPDGRDPDAWRARPTGWCRSPARCRGWRRCRAGCAFHPRCSFAFARCHRRAAGAGCPRGTPGRLLPRRGRAGVQSPWRSRRINPGLGSSRLSPRSRPKLRRRPAVRSMTEAPLVEVSGPAPRLRRLATLARPRAGAREPAIAEGRRRRLLRHRQAARPSRSWANPAPARSTVARMVVGLLPPTAGEVLIDGVSMTDQRGRG